MSIDYHALGICTPEEGKALKEAGYRKTPQLADAYWHDGEQTLYWVRVERESDISLTCPSIPNAVYLKTSIDNYYIRLPRLQELLEWDGHPTRPPLLIGRQDEDLLSCAVQAVLHVLKERKLPTFTIGPGVGPSDQKARSVTPPVQVPMRYEYRGTEITSSNFKYTLDRMLEHGWEPFQLTTLPPATIFQVWRRWVPVEVKS